MSKFYNIYAKKDLDLSKKLEGGADYYLNKQVNDSLEKINNYVDAYNKNPSNRNVHNKLINELTKYDNIRKDIARNNPLDPDQIPVIIPLPVFGVKYYINIPKPTNLIRTPPTGTNIISLTKDQKNHKNKLIEKMISTVMKHLNKTIFSTIPINPINIKNINIVSQIIRIALRRMLIWQINEFLNHVRISVSKALKNLVEKEGTPIAITTGTLIANALLQELKKVDMSKIQTDLLIRAIKNSYVASKDVFIAGTLNQIQNNLLYKYTTDIYEKFNKTMISTCSAGIIAEALLLINNFININSSSDTTTRTNLLNLFINYKSGATINIQDTAFNDITLNAYMQQILYFPTKGDPYANVGSKILNFVSRYIDINIDQVYEAAQVFVPPTKPSRLTIKIKDIKSNEMTIQWDALKDKDMPSQYTIYVSSDNISWTLKKTDITLPNVTEYTLPDLTKSTRYYIKVSATNSEGEGDSSDVLDFTTKNTDNNTDNNTQPIVPPSPNEPDENIMNIFVSRMGDVMKNIKDPEKFSRVLEDMLTNFLDYPQFRLENNQNFLSHSLLCGKKVSGAKCIKLLHKCLSGDKIGCIEEWNSLDFSNGVIFDDADPGEILKMARRLGLDNKSVEMVVKDLEDNTNPTGTGPKVSPNVKIVFQAIKNMVSPESRTIIPEVLKKPDVPIRNSITNRGYINYVGGSSNIQDDVATGSYSNFIRSIDALKNNHSMVGGIGINNTALVTRGTVAEFVSLLKNMGKQIDEDDLKTINEEIFSLERTEKRIIKLYTYITVLNRAIKASNLDLSSETGNITLNIIERLAEKQEKAVVSMNTKFTSIGELLSTLAEIMNDYKQSKKK